ncbi:hypothetical protein AAKU52_000996 [Pedobacter sp. CG_S7]
MKIIALILLISSIVFPFTAIKELIIANPALPEIK